MTWVDYRKDLRKLHQDIRRAELSFNRSAEAYVRYDKWYREGSKVESDYKRDQRNVNKTKKALKDYKELHGLK